jgi:hypothetical protein
MESAASIGSPGLGASEVSARGYEGVQPVGVPEELGALRGAGLLGLRCGDVEVLAGKAAPEDVPRLVGANLPAPWCVLALSELLWSEYLPGGPGGAAPARTAPALLSELRAERTEPLGSLDEVTGASGTRGPRGSEDLGLLSDGHFMLLRARSRAHALARLRWAGPTNHGLSGEDLLPVLERWEERWGADVVLAGPDFLVLDVERPPLAAVDALKLAREVYAMCPDAVEQGAGSVGALASGMAGTRAWYLWWD